MKSFALLVLGTCCAASAAEQKAAPAEKAAKVRPIFTSQAGLAAGWSDLGWAPRQIGAGEPVRLDLSSRGGWIVANEDLDGTYLALRFRLRAPSSFGDFLDVRLDSERVGRFPRVHPRLPELRQPDGWADVEIPFSELNPKGAPFDRVVFEATRDVGSDPVFLDRIALVEEDRAGKPPRAKAVRLSLDCTAAPRPISPLIYGVAHGEAGWWETGATARRWGGNPNTRYNWELGNAWNSASDFFFRNYGTAAPGATPAWQSFLDEDRAHGVAAAITVPLIGWVAKDTTSYSFPVSVFGAQRVVGPQNPDMGNGIAQDGTLLQPGPPTRTSVQAPPSFIGRWVSAIRERVKAKGGSVSHYILDNEPTLWSITHRDVHPEPVGYDELLERTLQYGTAVRQADPDARMAGFVGWGWTSFFYSARDAEPSYTLQLDRRAHGGEPLLPWWLRRVREQEKRTGTRLIDVLDVHFYPAAEKMGIGTAGGVDPDTAARRIRAARSLWDPTYSDESWIGEPVILIPRLKRWIAEYAPGMSLSIGEYNFGAETHMSGGLALAEALGRFGEQGLDSAYYWTVPPKGSPAFWAFRAFRNYDGKGGHFL
ncbi:MAG TPA: glycoside hydrolase family 44 protein, partial [Myxococcales bacterium]|nr:glycoside hydrolase family 44 protein [Myxococcales bacterium]